MCQAASAGSTLAENGFNVARTHIEQSAQRGYLVLERFDRIGMHGRHHVVSIGKAHEAFVQGTYRNWAESSAALANRGCLSRPEAQAAGVIRDFGRLIGNSDMHGGNLALYVDIDGIRRGRFVLAPVYDMLPMRWKPDALQGGRARLRGLRAGALGPGVARCPHGPLVLGEAFHA